VIKFSPVVVLVLGLHFCMGQGISTHTIAGVLQDQTGAVIVGAEVVLLAPDGSNVGTTSTAWLVSLKLTSIGPFFIVFGTLLSALPIRFKVLGKAAFYFGFIFFSLEVVSFTLKPLAQNPLFAEVLSRSTTPLAASSPPRTTKLTTPPKPRICRLAIA